MRYEFQALHKRLWKYPFAFLVSLSMLMTTLSSTANAWLPIHATPDEQMLPGNRTEIGISPATSSRHEQPSTLPQTGVKSLNSAYMFGVINDQGQHYADLWERGVRATTFEFQWKRYEPQEGIFDQDYIDHMQGILRQLKNQGWYVQMVPGFHYTPKWVFSNYPDMYFVNQHGDVYNPDPLSAGDFRVTNAPFNPQARALIATYLERVFRDFNQNDPLLRFDAIRVGGVVQGELRFPPAEWNGHANSYWAFDVYAQNPEISGIPSTAVGWRPGIDPNPGTAGRGQLIVNPGFERNHPQFQTFAWSPDDQLAAEIQSQQVHSGQQALKVTLDAPYRIHQFVRVDPNTSYEFGNWSMSGTEGGQARLIITQYDANTQLVSEAPFAKLETEQSHWTSSSGAITTTPSTAFLKVEMDGNQPGDYYFDDLWLMKAGETNQQDRDIEVPLAFYEWYLTTLNDYQNWQIDEIRKYFQGPLDLVYAGKGLLPKQITDALTNDLQGDGWSEQGSALYAGTDYNRNLNGLKSSIHINVYLTGIEDPPVNTVDDFSPYASNWSAAHWLAYLARLHGMSIWGENSGSNSPAELELVIDRMLQNGFTGLMWAFESDLYANPNPEGYATILDYEIAIHQAMNAQRVFLPLVKNIDNP